MQKLTYLIALAGMYLLGACGQKAAHDHDYEGHHHETESHDGHHHGHENESSSHEGHSDEIILTPERARAAGVESEIIRPGAFHSIIRTSGQVLEAQGEERVAVATVAGVVKFTRPLTEGIQVSQGQPLLQLSAEHLADGDPTQKTRIAYEAARKEYERMEPLMESRIVSAKEFAAVKQAYETARVAYEATAAHHGKGGQSVTAPMGGYVKNLSVKEGDYVEVGQPLFRITQHRKLYLRADVPERYYARLHTIRSAHFTTPYADHVFALDSLGGRLLSYGKSSGTQGHYLPVTFEFDNRVDIVPGSYVEVYLISSPMEQVITLPQSALTEEQGSHFVYLQVDEEGYKKQLVTLGEEDGQRVQITSGLQGGERVVVRGAYQVKLASASNVLPAHSHEH